MGALVFFEADGAWGETLACDGRIRAALAAEGIGWGRWPLHELDDAADDAAVIARYAHEIATLPPQLAPRSIDRLRLRPGQAGWPALRRQFLAEHRHADAELRFFLEGAGLFYIRTAQGFIGLLCEAGEWVALPPGTRHGFDAGESPDIDVLRFFTAAEGWLARPAEGALPAALPSFDGFVETMLELTGHAAAEEEG